MNRLDSLEHKTDVLLRNSFASLNMDNPTNQITEGVTHLIEFMKYFEDKPIYVMDLPILLIPHPEGTRHMVDPRLRGTPTNKSISVETRTFDDIYTLVERFNEHLEQNKEIFIYTITPLTLFTPTTFEPNFRFSVRYTTIDMDYWYTPVEEYVGGNNIYIPEIMNQNTPTDREPLKILNRVLRHDFK